MSVSFARPLVQPESAPRSNQPDHPAESLARDRYIAAMRAAWILSGEATAVAKAAMDLALLEWVTGASVPPALAADIAETAARMIRATDSATAACANG